MVNIAFSQVTKKDTLKKEIPLSIYTATQTSAAINSSLNLNKRLDLTSFNFLILNEKDIEMGNFTIPLSNMKFAKSDYIYDFYTKIHQKSILEASFFKVSDLYKSRTKNSL